MYVFSFLGENFLVFYYQPALDFKHKVSQINWIDKNFFLREEKEGSSVMTKGLSIFSNNPELPCVIYSLLI